MSAASTVQDARPVKDFVQSVRSDELPKLSDALRRMMPYCERIGMFQVDLIVDSNVVIRDLLWLAKKRTNPQARTEFMELMDCEVVRSHAPCYLLREVKTNIPEVAKEHDLDPAVLEGLWKGYRTKIKFVAVGGPARRGNWRDPKDAPYIRLQRRLKVPIISEDPDLPAMGARVTRIQIFGPLRSYSRATAVEYRLKFSGAGIAALLAAVGGSLFKAVRRIPPPILFGAGAVALLALVHPTSRKKILEIGSVLLKGSGQTAGALMDAVQPLLEKHDGARRSAQTHLDSARQRLA